MGEMLCVFIKEPLGRDAVGLSWVNKNGCNYNNMWMENHVGLSMRGRKAPHAHKNQTAELMRSNSLRITEADACKYR